MVRRTQSAVRLCELDNCLQVQPLLLESQRAIVQHTAVQSHRGCSSDHDESQRVVHCDGVQGDAGAAVWFACARDCRRFRI
jgi:hypothetical protein